MNTWIVSWLGFNIPKILNIHVWMLLQRFDVTFGNKNTNLWIQGSNSQLFHCRRRKTGLFRDRRCYRLTLQKTQELFSLTERARKTATLHPKITVTKGNGELERNKSSNSESLRTPNLRSILQSPIALLIWVTNSTEPPASLSIEQSPCPCTSRSNSHWIPCGLCNRKILQRVKNNPPLVPILSQMKPLRILQPCCKVCFNITFTDLLNARFQVSVRTAPPTHRPYLVIPMQVQLLTYLLPYLLHGADSFLRS